MAGGHSTYLANNLAGLAIGGTAFARPATLYLEPFEGNPNEAGAGGDVPDLGYSARVAVTNNTTEFPNAASSVKTMANQKILYVASGIETILSVGIWDALTSGNLLALFPRTGGGLATVSGKRLKIPAGTLTLTLTGAWETALENALLDHVFGGPDYTPVATLHIGLIASGTTEITGTSYARIAKTNNTTNFPAWTAGATSNGTEIVFGPAGAGDWTAANRVGIYDASTAGNLLAVANLDAAVTVANGETATFDVGELDFTFTASFA